MIKLTLDTNIVWDFLDEKRPDHACARKLVSLDEAGICEIRLISRINADLPNGSVRVDLDQQEFAQRPRIGTIGEWDISAFDEDFWATDEEIKMSEKLFAEIFPNTNPNSKKQMSRNVDIGHLVGHWRAERDIFVTRDQPILNRSEELDSNFGIRVMSSCDVVTYCKRKLKSSEW